MLQESVEEIVKKYSQELPNGCIIWTRGKYYKNAYGIIGIEGKIYRVHRVVYELKIGKIPPEMVIDHLCENKKCINTLHMELVSSGENSRRAVQRKKNSKAARKSLKTKE